MTRILLVDDSPHAQRMGERILSDEGYEVVTVSNADSALIRLEDVDPDIVVADTVMPGRTGYDICQYVKMNPRRRHVRVILTAGVLEPIDPSQAARVQADGSVNKPFEASVLVATIKPLAEAAARDRASGGTAAKPGSPIHGPATAKTPLTAFVAVVDAEQVRAAVTVALDAAMGTMVDAIAARVLTALQTKKSEPPPANTAETARADESAPTVDRSELESAPRATSVRRVNPLRRPGSILGLDVDSYDAPAGPTAGAWPPVASPRPATGALKPAVRPVPGPSPEFAAFPETGNRQPGPAPPNISWAPLADSCAATVSPEPTVDPLPDPWSPIPHPPTETSGHKPAQASQPSPWPPATGTH